MEKGALFPLFYLPPIEYFTKLIQFSDNVVMENQENFPKQTYRTRASIHSPNGKLELIIPLVRGSKGHTPMKDVKISYEFNWQRAHLMGIQTTYRSSAYFEFYENEFVPFYEKKWNFLVDYNDAILQALIRMLKLKITYKYTEEYKEQYEGLVDLRESMKPKQALQQSVKPYYQVFEERNGFINNMSIIDLLFSQGPQSINYL